MYTPYTSDTAPPAKLSRERILATGRAIAEREGLDALSMRSLARALDVTPMALYRHVDGKDDLLDGLLDLMLADLEAPDPSAPWQQRLRLLAAEIRALAGRHPRLFVLLLQRPAVGADAVAARELVEAALFDAGLAPAEAARMQRLLSTVVIGFALSEVSGRFEGIDADAEFEAAIELLLGAVEGR